MAPTPVTDQAPAPLHVKDLTHAPAQTCVKPIALVRDQVTSLVNAKAQDPDHAPAQDHVQPLDPPFPHCLTVSCLKGHRLPLSPML